MVLIIDNFHIQYMYVVMPVIVTVILSLQVFVGFTV